jgi:hypothetical protein
MQRSRNLLLTFLFTLALLLPWLIFLFLPGGTAGHALFWLTIFFCLLLIWMGHIWRLYSNAVASSEQNSSF